jgi:hypothetical protein
MKTFTAILKKDEFGSFYRVDRELFICVRAVRKFGKHRKKKAIVKLASSPRKGWRKATFIGREIFMNGEAAYEYIFPALEDAIAQVCHARTGIFYFKIE